VLRFPNSQVLDLAGLVGRATSASYVPVSGPAHERLVAGLRAIHAKHSDAFGNVEVGYETTLYLGERAP
jgi:hypothetical protein